MFPLFQKNFPADAEELRAALESSLTRIVTLGNPAVTLQASAFPVMENLSVRLSGGKLKADLPKQSALKGKTPTALRANHLSVEGQGLSLGGAALDLDLQARNVSFAEGRDAQGDAVLLIQNAEEGALTLAIARADLESIIAQIAKLAAAKQGVTIEDVRLTLQPSGVGAVAGEVELRARKLFVKATVRLTGRVAIDEKLTAQLSELHCAGEGALGTMACGVLQPQLQKWNGQSFSLQALPLGELQVRSLQVDAADGIKIRAEFGANPTALA